MAGPCVFCGAPVWKLMDCCVDSMKSQEAGLLQTIDFITKQRDSAREEAARLKQFISDLSVLLKNMEE